jgi:anti-sigma factor RsiW
MTACRNTSKISAYHDGELPPAEAEELGRHLRQCADCRQELQELRAISRWLSGSAPPAPPVAVGRLRGHVQPGRDWLVIRVARAVTIAAAAVLIVCAALLWQRQSAAPSPEPWPARWETAAVAAPTSQPALPAFEAPARTEFDADIQIAQSLLGDELYPSSNEHNDEDE